MEILENFFNWIIIQNRWKESVIFNILYMAPDFDTTNLDMEDQVSNLDKYIHSDSRPINCIGKIIYITNAIDFNIEDYDNVDSLIDSQNTLKSAIESGESKGHPMHSLKKLYADGAERFEEKKDFKNSWIEFKEDNLNAEILNEFLKREFLKGK